MNSFVIQCRDVRKSFGSKQVLKGIHLEILRGSVFGLLGKNGSGKTTLIKLMLGLLKPHAGSILVLGEDPQEFSEQVKERFGYVPQRERLYPWLTVSELIRYTASFYRHWNHDLIENLRKSWQLPLHERIGTLSEGEAQKVSILLALGHEPELLILDEPAASLDPLARRQFLKMVLELVADRECTILFSTHITSDLERVADHVALLKEGTVAFSGELEGLRETVKRLRIIGVSPTREELGLPHVLNYQRTANGVMVTVKNFDTQLHRQLQTRFQSEILVENLNLEEIFLELSA